MFIKSIIQEDVVNYKKISMYIAFPYCTFKCCKESGVNCCQNSPLATAPNIDVSVSRIVDLYMSNKISKAFIFAGLEPFDSYPDMLCLIDKIRKRTEDDIVIYTGYKETEIDVMLLQLKRYKNIIVKFGRYIPNDTPRYDDVLGVTLASSNQYAKQISGGQYD